MKIKRNNKQGGFTLVELAVVMVIIGILLSAILKGQDLINNARAKTVLSEMKGVEAMIWAYYDRQARFPGDCDESGYMGLAITKLATAAGTPEAADALDSDDGATTDPNTFACDTGSGTGATTKTADASFGDLRVEHLLPWNTANDKVTEHRYNGNIHVTHINNAATPPILRNAIVVFNIPQWVGEMIDASIDGEVDGEAGRIRYIALAATDLLTLAGTSWPARTNADLEIAIAYYFDEVAPLP